MIPTSFLRWNCHDSKARAEFTETTTAQLTTIMPHPVFSKSSTALITGGSSGIGLAIGHLCAKHGMKLAIADINPETLATAKSSFQQDAEVETYNVDVSSTDAWKKLKIEVGRRFGGINLLVLNAGVGPKSGFDDVEPFHKVGPLGHSFSF